MNNYIYVNSTYSKYRYTYLIWKIDFIRNKYSFEKHLLISSINQLLGLNKAWSIEINTRVRFQELHYTYLSNIF